MSNPDVKISVTFETKIKIGWMKGLEIILITIMMSILSLRYTFLEIIERIGESRHL